MDWDALSDKLGQFGENVGSTLKGLFGARNERMVKDLTPLVKRINELESWAKGLSAEQFQEETARFKQAVQSGEKTLDEIIPPAFALVREASVRTLGMRHFDVQLVGGIVLHQGKIAEMSTGEGKTLVATLPLYLNALSGKTVYLVTVNDYLARRDAAWMGPIYDYLGVAVGAIQSDMSPWERQPVYMCDIVYGTNNEFGFDYLRDNMKSRTEDQVQKMLPYAIVDEVDSILIDEARTPLIISGPARDTSDKYKKADEIARVLEKEKHFEVKEKERTVALLEAGIEVAESMVGVPSFFVPPHEEWLHFVENALRAHHLYHLDKEYVVEAEPRGEGGDGAPGVIIVDEFTGRKMHGRRWSDGLHQAVETKEGLKPRQENETLATITLQNYFRMYKKLAGMTGTALTEAGEFHKIYGLDVISIPTNLPITRDDADDIVYRTEPEKWRAIVNELELHHSGRPPGALDADGKPLPPFPPGQPVLVGTTSIEKSEHLSKLLKERGIPHDVLNAKNHEREAHIIAMAGEKGAVTVATNMAGRGTDIKLGGNLEYRLNKALEEAGLALGDLEKLAEIDAIRATVREKCDRDQKEVLSLGGLYVLGTERHEARRIDNQLRGRGGRQGDVGKSRFYLSLEDDLMRIFYREWVKNAMARMGMTEDVPIESGMVTRAIAKAQKKVEDRNFEIRKNVLEYDEVMNQQRKEIYGTRQEVLESVGLREKVEIMLGRVVERNARTTHLEDPEGLRTWFQRSFGFEIDHELARDAVAPKQGNFRPILDLVLKRYTERETAIGPEFLRQVERYLLLKALDDKWRDHLQAMDALRHGIGLRGYGQVDPKNEYKREGFQLFERLLHAIEDDVTSLILRIEVNAATTRLAPSAPAPRFVSPAGAPSATIAERLGAAPADAGAAASGGGAAAAGSDRVPASVPAAASGGAPPAPPRAPAERRLPPPASIPASHLFDVARRQQALAQAREAQARGQSGGGAPATQTRPPLAPADAKGVGRNDPCPCGSGRKYKACHGKGP